MPNLDELRRMVVAKHTLQIGHRGHLVTYHLIPPGERVGDVQSVLSSPHEGLIEQLLSELDRLRSRVRGLEADLRLERAELKALEHTLVNELTRSPCWPYDSAPDEPCSRINYLQHLRYLKARAARVEELEAKLAEAREVVRPFAGKSAYFSAKSEDIRRAADWLRRQEE